MGDFVVNTSAQTTFQLHSDSFNKRFNSGVREVYDPKELAKAFEREVALHFRAYELFAEDPSRSNSWLKLFNDAFPRFKASIEAQRHKLKAKTIQKAHCDKIHNCSWRREDISVWCTLLLLAVTLKAAAARLFSRRA